MHFNPLTLLLPALLLISRVLAQGVGEPVSGQPDVTYPDSEAIIVCSDQNCQGTCEIVDGNYLITNEHTVIYPPGDMGFLSIYWYDPNHDNWTVETCINWDGCEAAVSVGPNTCYNLYSNGDAAYYYIFYWVQN